MRSASAVSPPQGSGKTLSITACSAGVAPFLTLQRWGKIDTRYQLWEVLPAAITLGIL
ncbi:hypothetical protein [Okeania hirsuta]|uniref:hypothetical protein n=1 Tax=Okeania hirsuta TaxID=1458930 RepID=UPI0013751631|nr:hypothetical protein [Okeania hirsuta]